MKAGMGVRSVRHFTLSTFEKQLPLYIESIGYHAEGRIERDHGYTEYHWIQTMEGEGEFHFAGGTYILPPNHGVLLLPHVPHEYAPVSERWNTFYLTFGGTQAKSILSSFGLHYSSVYSWQSDTPLSKNVVKMTHQLQKKTHSGLEGSALVYQFITFLKAYARQKNKPSLSNTYKRLRPLIEWLEEQFHDPSISLHQMAGKVSVSPQHLNTLFHSLFGMSPYAYLIQLRISKSKEIMVSNPHVTIKRVAERVGFYDASHYIATFRKLTGITPAQFRKAHCAD